ncbi:MAG: carbamoyl phosphate synthase small subunit [Deltaproteobacteria bacterium]|nr:MAG: carbamoyl phosphate synthase small subunit [Deltaproteobacteria bacterium]PIE74549.1 MAG: carbamoyl phosphate synthase small subunit [Deltaproteobacteria bacterium]
MEAVLALEDGTIFRCRSFTGAGEAFGEIVFNTSMTGYQEILTDPSYNGQMVVMTYPLIGNYGVNSLDIESDKIQVSSFILKEYQDFPSNFRSEKSLKNYLLSEKIMGIHDLDTRGLTLHLRQKGSMRAFITTNVSDPLNAVEKARAVSPMSGSDLVKNVTTKKPYFWADNSKKYIDSLEKKVWQHEKKPKVCVFDFGVKFNILRLLEAEGFEVLVVPASTNSEIIKKLEPDGIFLSNGPGDPEPVAYAINTIKELIGFKPIFGICLGNQLLGLALGGSTYKLKFGHRGANQAVRCEAGRVEVTSQNHGFAVDIKSLENKDIEITHVNVNDGTLEGFRHKKYPVFCVQHHPEASPGPHDSSGLFNDFMEMVRAFKKK